VFGLKNSGNFKDTFDFLKRINPDNLYSDLDAYGQMGADALARATPTDSGLTSRSWGYRIKGSGTSVQIEWYNTNVNKGVPIAIIIQYGHGTGTGGYVVGRDYINPAIRPVFDKIQDDIWKKVSS